jgi:hypothetical protein
MLHGLPSSIPLCSRMYYPYYISNYIDSESLLASSKYRSLDRLNLILSIRPSISALPKNKV